MAAPHVAAQLQSWKMLPKAEQYTAIYFAKPQELPHAYAPGDVQTVSFTTANHTQSTAAYHYRIYADTSAGIADLSTGSMTINANATSATNTAITLPDLGARIRITVVITGGNDQHTITYWITRKGA
jgi:hypothetical protein